MSTRLPQAPDLYEHSWAAELVRQLELELESLSRNFAADYTTSNVTTTRSLDVSTATLADVANVLATLIEDLKPRSP